jgi:negative regulator of sigma F NrsF-like protein
LSAPEPLLRAVARDLRAVKPLRPPVRRALALLPLAVVIVAGVPLLHFFRSDMATLGLFGSWGLSFVEVIGGLLVVALALRESIPGRALPLFVVVAALAAGVLLPYAILSATARDFTTGAPPGAEWSDGIICFRTSATAAIPALLASALLAFRALPLRPAVTGALYGLGSALVGDAGLRLFCEFTVPSHVIGAHGGAIVLVVAAGVVVSKCSAGLSGPRTRRP